MTLTLFAAYGQSCQVDFVYRETNGTAINVTGYSAEFQIRRPDGSLLGALLSTTSGGNITNGGVNGTFGVTVPEATIDALSTVCGNPPRRAVSWRMVVTPGGGDPIDLGAGALRVSPEGTVIVSQTVNAVTPTYQTTVTAIGSRGPTGATGAQGPPGTGTEPDTDVTTTASTSSATLRTRAVTSSRKSTLRVECVITRTSDSLERVMTGTVVATCDGAGATTITSVSWERVDDVDLGAIGFTGGTNLVTMTGYPGEAGQLKWRTRVELISETTL